MLLYYHLRRRLMAERNNANNDIPVVRQQTPVAQPRSRTRRRSRAEYNRRALRLLQSTSTDTMSTSEESFVPTRGDNSSTLESEYEIETSAPAISPADGRKPVYRPGVIKPTATTNMLSTTLESTQPLCHETQPSTSGLSTQRTTSKRNIESGNLYKLVTSTSTINLRSSSNKVTDDNRNSSNSNSRPDNVYHTIGTSLEHENEDENNETPNIYRKCMTYEFNSNSSVFKAILTSEIIISQQGIDSTGEEQSTHETFESENLNKDKSISDNSIFNNLKLQKDNVMHESYNTKENHRQISSKRGLKLNKIRARDQKLHSKHKTEMQRSKQRTKKCNMLQSLTIKTIRNGSQSNLVMVEKQLQTETCDNSGEQNTINTCTSIDIYIQTPDLLQQIDEELQTDNNFIKVDTSTDTESCDFNKKVLLISQSTSSTSLPVQHLSKQNIPNKSQHLILPTNNKIKKNRISINKYIRFGISSIDDDMDTLSWFQENVDLPVLQPTTINRLINNSNMYNAIPVGSNTDPLEKVLHNKSYTMITDWENKNEKDIQQRVIRHPFQSTGDIKDATNLKNSTRTSHRTYEYDTLLKDNEESYDTFRSRSKERTILPVRIYVLQTSKEDVNSLSSTALPVRDTQDKNETPQPRMLNSPYRKLDGANKIGTKLYRTKCAQLVPCQCKKCLYEQRTTNECQPTRKQNYLNKSVYVNTLEQEPISRKPRKCPSLLSSDELSIYSHTMSCNSYKSVLENESIYFDVDVQHPSRCDIENELEKKMKHTSLLNATALQDQVLLLKTPAETYIGKPLSKTKKISNLAAVQSSIQSSEFENNQ